MMRRVILLCLSIIMITGVYGCMENSNRLSDGHQMMMDYINDKYGDTFEFVSVYGGSPASDMHSIWVSSKAYPDRLISVSCCDDGETMEFYDNYLSVKFERQTQDFLYGLFKKYGAEVKILYAVDNLACTDNGSDATAFEEYIADRSSSISFTAIIRTPEKVDSSIVDSIKQDISDAGLCCSAEFYFCTDHPDMDQLTPDNYYAEYTRFKTYDAHLYIYMNMIDSFESVQWEELR